MAVMLAVVLVAELVVRVEAHRLAPPVTWLTPEAQVKAAQLRALHREGRTGGVVFFSSSVLDVGIDPVAFVGASGTHLPVYNGSLSGANMDELRWWTDRVVIPALHPRIAVVGISSREVNANDPQAASLAKQFFASPSVRQIDGTETVEQRIERYADDVSYLFRYRKSIRSPSQILHEDAAIQVQQKYLTSPGGQELALSAQSYRSDEGATIKSTFLDKWQVSPAEVATLGGIIADLQASGAKVVLVDAPVTEDYVDLHPHGATDYAAYRHALTGLAAAAHVPYLPGAVWPTTFFADPLHLNENGARRLSAQLGTQLMPMLTGSDNTNPGGHR